MIPDYIVLLIILICVIGYGSGITLETFSNSNSEYPCRSVLTDNQYLIHMITHHEMAVMMSEKHQAFARNSVLRSIIRELLWTQKYEIELMKEVLHHPVDNVSVITANTSYVPTIVGSTFPNRIELTNTYCDPNFFNTHGHMGHTNTLQITDTSYIEHMIPHHQVAIDMSKILLLNTKNDFMIGFAYRIIRDQEKEVLQLNDLLYSPLFF